MLPKIFKSSPKWQNVAKTGHTAARVNYIFPI